MVHDLQGALGLQLSSHLVPVQLLRRRGIHRSGGGGGHLPVTRPEDMKTGEKRIMDVCQHPARCLAQPAELRSARMQRIRGARGGGCHSRRCRRHGWQQHPVASFRVLGCNCAPEAGQQRCRRPGGPPEHPAGGAWALPHAGEHGERQRGWPPQEPKNEENSGSTVSWSPGPSPSWIARLQHATLLACENDTAACMVDLPLGGKQSEKREVLH